VLRLRFVDDLDAAEVATRLGIARAAVDQRVARAKRLMREALDANPELAAELRQPHPRLY
jgi:DNA-directed RNA polymerase specialized sigma24 family protein